MDSISTINFLSILVLLLFVVALVFFIVLLYRANRILSRFEHLNETIRDFVAGIVPAIVNVGTIASAIEGILRALHKEGKFKNKKGEGSKK